MDTNTTKNAILLDIRASIDRRLAELMEGDIARNDRTSAAMRYTLLAPAKRLRGVITVLIGECLGVGRQDCLIPACAIEMAHAASLIVDDLPCMDDATLRRGQPANHLRFGDDVAILAALCLITEAYRVVAEAEELPAETRLRIGTLLSRSLGLDGLIGGQEKDLHGPPATRQSTVSDIHREKTATLFVAAAEAGAIVARASETQISQIRAYAERIGLAFQTLDDIIDALGCSDAAGKDTRRDAGRPNMVTLVGRDRALKDVFMQIQNANALLAEFGGSADNLGALGRSIFEGAWSLAHSAAPTLTKSP